MNLTEARKRAGMNRQTAAHHLGIAISTLRAWEKGINIMPSSTLPSIRDLYHLTDSEAMGLLTAGGQE